MLLYEAQEVIGRTACLPISQIMQNLRTLSVDLFKQIQINLMRLKCNFVNSNFCPSTFSISFKCTHIDSFFMQFVMHIRFFSAHGLHFGI